MGFLDFLFDKEKAQRNQYRKLRKSLTNMYVQAGEREYAIQSLRELGTPEAVDVLLARFEETSPNHTTDAEEKQYVYSVLVDLGRRKDADVVTVITEYLKRINENINWPLKVLTDLTSREDMIGLIVELFEASDIEYLRNPEKKRELMLRAAEFKAPELAEQIIRFLEDDNETIRFLAVDALMAQDEDALAEEPLRKRLGEEDSLRILQKLADIFVDHQDWRIPDDEVEDVKLGLPDGYGLNKDGRITKTR